MSFLKNIWRTSSKHRKLSEEWALAKNNRDALDSDYSESIEDNNENDENKDNNIDGDDSVTFQLKYIGSTLVDRATNEATTAEAIKTILRVAKATGKKLSKVTVTVSLKGIQISDEKSDKDNEISIYRISYCSADASHSRVFAFIAANSNETMECHAFLCSKRKQAQAVTLAVARSFSMAYEAWRVLPSSTNKQKHTTNNQIIEHPHQSLNQLIDLDDFDHTTQNTFATNQDFHKNQWVSFDDENDSQRWINKQPVDLIYS